MEFNCSGCGACCKRIGLLKDKFKEFNFPYKVNEKGWCEMLDENNKCKVYENRPQICNVDKMYSVFMKMGMTKKEYYVENTKMCNLYIREDKSDEKYLLDEKFYNNLN